MSADALVLGGGPAGSSLAARLARAGREVVLVEREARAHHKVCGEFISGEAAADLQALGLDLLAHGAERVRVVRLAARGEAAEAALPFPAFSLSRLRLDEALLGLAQRSGARLRRGIRAKAIAPAGSGWRARLQDGEAIEARDAFLAVGKHDLKDLKRRGGLQTDLVAFKTHLRLAPAQAAVLKGAVELYLFPDGYAGLEPVEDGLANLCLLLRRRALAGRSGWTPLLDALRGDCALLGERLEGALTLWPRPLSITALPYGHLARSGDGLWRVGDQAAAIPAFCGDGLAIALHSARRAAGAYLGGQTVCAFQQALADDLRLQVVGSAILSQVLVRPWAQGLVAWAAKRRPELLTAVAARTRIPRRALAGA